VPDDSEGFQVKDRNLARISVADESTGQFRNERDAIVALKPSDATDDRVSIGIEYFDSMSKPLVRPVRLEKV
jgi:hypothetical protein